MSESTIKETGWPCACVKRDRKGNLTHIRVNDASVRKCRDCGSVRPPKRG